MTTPKTIKTNHPTKVVFCVLRDFSPSQVCNPGKFLNFFTWAYNVSVKERNVKTFRVYGDDPMREREREKPERIPRISDFV